MEHPGLGRVNDAGKRVRITRTVRGSRRDAEKELISLLHDVDRGSVADPGRLRIGRVALSKLRPMHVQAATLRSRCPLLDPSARPSRFRTPNRSAQSFKRPREARTTFHCSWRRPWAGAVARHVRSGGVASISTAGRCPSSRPSSGSMASFATSNPRPTVPGARCPSRRSRSRRFGVIGGNKPNDACSSARRGAITTWSPTGAMVAPSIRRGLSSLQAPGRRGHPLARSAARLLDDAPPSGRPPQGRERSPWPRVGQLHDGHLPAHHPKHGRAGRRSDAGGARW